MCGILGFSNNEINFLANQQLLRKIGTLQYHRGPDEWGEYINDEVSLGHNRLSIIDLDTGQQPLTSHDGRFIIIFNGEIYNYKILRNELSKKNIKFNTNSDTEVLVNGFSLYGTDFLTRLSGMYSFAIYDTIKSTIILCRDHIGIKPLYYSVSDKNFIFSSEIKPILLYKKINHKSLDINNNSFIKYFHFRTGSNTSCLINDINLLAPGNFLIYDIKNNIISKKGLFTTKVNIANDVSLDILDSLLNDSVQSHMISDVPLGIFLSGGIDSSLITYYASKNRQLSTFTLATESKYDESDFAKYVSKKYSCNHYNLNINPQDFIKKIPYWNFINDDPVSDPSALALMLLSDFVNKKGFKVMLAGEGADELFAGYYSYLKFLILKKTKNIPLLGDIINYIISTQFPKSKDYTFGQNYLGSAHITSFEEKKSLFNKQYLLSYNDFSFELPSQNHVLLNACLSDQNMRLPNDVLLRTDRATMAYSIETRVPFLSPDIISFSKTLGENDLIDWRRLQGKKILKKLALRQFSSNFVYRKKVGFELPIKDWLKHDFKDLVHSFLSKKQFDEINYEFISNTYKKGSNTALIWAWFTLENWKIMVDDINQNSNHPLLNSNTSNQYFNNQPLL